jgi:hypothetical protein
MPAFAQTRRPQKKNSPSQTAPGNESVTENALRFVGVWTAEFMDTTYLRLELKLANGNLTGAIATGDIHTAEDGRLTDVTAAEKDQTTALFDVSMNGDTITFKRRDGDDVDQMQMTWTGNGAAELRFVFPQSQDAPKIQPIQLTRRIER